MSSNCAVWHLCWEGLFRGREECVGFPRTWGGPSAQGLRPPMFPGELMPRAPPGSPVGTSTPASRVTPALQIAGPVVWGQPDMSPTPSDGTQGWGTLLGKNVISQCFLDPRKGSEQWTASLRNGECRQRGSHPPVPLGFICSVGRAHQGSPPSQGGLPSPLRLGLEQSTWVSLAQRFGGLGLAQVGEGSGGDPDLSHSYQARSPEGTLAVESSHGPPRGSLQD